MAPLLTKAAVAELVGISPVHIMRLVDAGKFPRPIKLTDARNSAVRFVAEEIDAWNADRMAARGSP